MKERKNKIHKNQEKKKKKGKERNLQAQMDGYSSHKIKKIFMVYPDKRFQ